MPQFGLSFANLEVRYGATRLLVGVSGQVERGEILLVAGRNGSGKSTLLRCLAGLQRPRQGQIQWRDEHGQANEDTSWRRSDLGWMAPDLALYPELSVAENLALFRRLRRLGTGDDGALIDAVGLPHDRPAGALSSGMMQRLRWIWALQGRPRLLLLDEPFQNLDPAGVEVISSMLADHLTNACAIVATPSPMKLPDAPKRTLELAS